MMRPFRSRLNAVLVGILLAGVLTWAGPASAQIFRPYDVPDFTTDDIALMRSISETVETAKPEQLENALALFAARQGLTAKQRLLILSVRTARLVEANAPTQAIKLSRAETLAYPDDPFPQMILAQAAYAANDYSTVANAVIAALRLQPDLVGQLSSYELKVLFDRLAIAKQDDLSNALARRLFDAGWTTGYVGLRSSAARALVADLLEKGDVTASRRYVVEVQIPAALAMMLSDNRYAPLHPTIADWAGPRLEKQWPIYLAEAKRAFENEGSAAAADEYASALISAKQDSTLLATFFPFAEQQFTKTEDEEWLFTIAKVASSLARQGRWDDSFASLDRASKLLDEDSQNAVNISANRARLRLMKGDFEAASKLFVPVIVEAKAHEAVGPSTMAWLESYRLCATHRHGSDQAKADASRLSASKSKKEPGALAWMWLCLGQPAAARDSWLSAVDDPDKLAMLLAYLQPDGDVTYDSAFALEMDRAAEGLRKDPALRSAVAKAGNIRSWLIADAAPKN